MRSCIAEVDMVNTIFVTYNVDIVFKVRWNDGTIKMVKM